MQAPLPRVFTIAPDKPFLETLARAVLDGFPLATPRAPAGLELPRWTILLPTRRAVRELEDTFFRLTGRSGLLLPRIRPLGDIDEDLLQPAEGDAGTPETPVSAPGQLLLLIDLIDDWARTNPHVPLAREIAEAPHQASGLAQSLAELLEAIETEEIDTARIPELYGIEAARHREAILDFLAIARETYPRRLAREASIGPVAGRSANLRREAARLAAARSALPFIAAGSTGSIRATGDLLKAIAGLPNGAVVLPGLDQAMDEASWLAVGPTHPQHALKRLLQGLDVPRQAVTELGEDRPGPRRWLVSELMRPAETAHLWRDSLRGAAAQVTAAMTGVELVETRSLQEQALTAALVLRHCLETPGQTGCLVTPDRQLARRVKMELRRWNIAIDDSAGEPLIRFGGAALLDLLLEALLHEFSAVPLAALLRHDLALFGASAEEARRAVSIIELALLRTGTGAPRIDKLAHALRLAAARGDHRHLVLGRVGAEEWERAALHCARISAAMEPLRADSPTTLAGHLGRLRTACEAIAGEAFWLGEGGELLAEAFARLEDEARFLASCDLGRAAAIIRHLLQGAAVRRQTHDATPLSILGLLEARLVRADVVVMAGLNEGTWPGAPDCGPWINRPMRELLGMKQPECQIGQTAHDFAQAFGAPSVKLLWSRRMGDAPATPSRWIHRLQMILSTAGLQGLMGGKSPWPMLARRLTEVETVSPLPMPTPRPPVGLRPKRLSVTRVETLIRDPYAIYAKAVLKLEPVNPIATLPDPARRGIIFHGAIGDFLNAWPERLPVDCAAQLEGFGEARFAEIADYPGLVGFWWPRFRRVAAWLAEHEPEMRDAVARTWAEIDGAITLDIGGESFLLSCRADRVDILADGGARIVDYKTGAVPSKSQVESGLAPQLTLQAAILAQGGFKGTGQRIARRLTYVKLSGGHPPGEITDLALGDVMDHANRHLAGLKGLLAQYAKERQSYPPRWAMAKEDDESPYDHLSRYREWMLSGDGG